MNYLFNEDLIAERFLSGDFHEQIGFIFQKLNASGFKCWVSGGAVRDALLQRPCHDIDLTTDADDSQILQLFPQAILTGRQFGVYKIPFIAQSRNIIIDLTIFREEDQYVDGRRPVSVKKSEPKADALRRDFTINALFFDLKNKTLIDYVGGQEDLKKGVLKCVGDPVKRFQEDHLRILRLIRFQSQFNFSIEQATLSAADQSVELICKVSAERITDELSRIVKSFPEREYWQQDFVKKVFKTLGLDIGSLNLESIQSLSDKNSQLFFIIFYFELSSRNQNLTLFFHKSVRLTTDQNQFFIKLVEQMNLVSKRCPDPIDVFLLVEKERKKGLSHIEYIYQYLNLIKIYPDEHNEVLRQFLNNNNLAQPLVSVDDLRLLKIEDQYFSYWLERCRFFQLKNDITQRDQILHWLAREIKSE